MSCTVVRAAVLENSSPSFQWNTERIAHTWVFVSVSSSITYCEQSQHYSHSSSRVYRVSCYWFNTKFYSITTSFSFRSQICSDSVVLFVLFPLHWFSEHFREIQQCAVLTLPPVCSLIWCVSGKIQKGHFTGSFKPRAPSPETKVSKCGGFFCLPFFLFLQDDAGCWESGSPSCHMT